METPDVHSVIIQCKDCGDKMKIRIRYYITLSLLMLASFYIGRYYESIKTTKQIQESIKLYDKQITYLKQITTPLVPAGEKWPE